MHRAAERQKHIALYGENISAKGVTILQSHGSVHGLANNCKGTWRPGSFQNIDDLHTVLSLNASQHKQPTFCNVPECSSSYILNEKPTYKHISGILYGILRCQGATFNVLDSTAREVEQVCSGAVSAPVTKPLYL